MFTYRKIRIAGFTLAVATTAIAAAAATGQQANTEDDVNSCQSAWSGDFSRFCEVRTLTMPAPNGALTVDGLTNGGITVTGGDVSNVRVEALVQAWSGSARDAEALAKQVRIVTDGGQIHAELPSGQTGGWSVSYRITAPKSTSLDLHAQNGGISVADVTGQLEIATYNGGIHLADVGGNVRGRTTNGGVHVDLKGDHFDGTGMDVTTTNGGVTLAIPSSYSARLETGTVNGRISTTIPFTTQGENAGRTLTTTLGQGGALIHVATHNGAVRVRRSS